MLVDVLRLRDKGVKLSKALLGEAVATRGELTVTDRFDAHRGQNVSIATLASGKADLVLPVLDYVLLTKLRGESFLLVGLEEVSHRKQVHNYPQCWWVKPASKFVEDDAPDEVRMVMIDAPQWQTLNETGSDHPNFGLRNFLLP